MNLKYTAFYNCVKTKITVNITHLWLTFSIHTFSLSPSLSQPPHFISHLQWKKARDALPSKCTTTVTLSYFSRTFQSQVFSGTVYMSQNHCINICIFLNIVRSKQTLGTDTVQGTVFRDAHLRPNQVCSRLLQVEWNSETERWNLSGFSGWEFSLTEWKRNNRWREVRGRY